MNLNLSTWKLFEVRKLFEVEYGVNLELDSLAEASDTDSINFVSRTRENNGISAKVKNIKGLKPQAAGSLTVAGGGSSVLSTYVQVDPFYSGRDLYLLRPLVEMSQEAKLFITTVIEQNKYRYSFGRQANTTLPYLEILLPIKYKGDNPEIDEENLFSDEGYIPDWKFMEDYIKSLRYKPLTTSQHSNTPLDEPFDMSKWYDFKIKKLFHIRGGIYHYSDEYQEGDTPYISASDTNNGIAEKISLAPEFQGNKITIGKIGATAYYQPWPFCATSDVNILTPKFEMTKYVALFITHIINFSENYKWSYGRQCRQGDTSKIVIKLPIKHDENGHPLIDVKKEFSSEGYVPDWEYMENFIKKLPYGDRL